MVHDVQPDRAAHRLGLRAKAAGAGPVAVAIQPVRKQVSVFAEDGQGGAERGGRVWLQRGELREERGCDLMTSR